MLALEPICHTLGALRVTAAAAAAAAVVLCRKGWSVTMGTTEFGSLGIAMAA